MAIKKNKDNLEDPEFVGKYGWLFEGMRGAEYEVAMFNVYFMLRRLYLALILTFLPDWTVLQVFSFVVCSFLNLVYLFRQWPYITNKDNWVEIGNETAVLMCALVIVDMINPANSSSKRNSLGWFLIYVVGGNVGFNLVLVGQAVFSDIINKIYEYILVY